MIMMIRTSIGVRGSILLQQIIAVKYGDIENAKMTKNKIFEDLKG